MKQIMRPNLFERIKRLIRIALPDAIIIAVLVVAAEIGLRMFAPQYADQIFSYRFTGGYPVAINADGYRGELVPIERSGDGVRLLALGDSTTFGTSVASESTWPQRLAVEMGERLGSDVEAINGSMPAASLRELEHAYTNKWAAYKPDRVVIAISNNFVALSYTRRDQDARMPANGFIEPASSRARLIAQAKELYNRPAVLRFISINTERLIYLAGLAGQEIANLRQPRGPMLAFGYRQPGRDEELGEVVEEAYELMEADLSGLVGALRSDGIEPIVAYLPSRFTLSDSVVDNEKFVNRERLAVDPSERLAVICERLGVEYVDAVEPLRAERADAEAAGDPVPSLYVQFDFTHLDERGHQTLASALADTINPVTNNPVENSP